MKLASTALIALAFAGHAAAQEARLTLERPIEFESLKDCREAGEVLEIMYRRFDVKPLVICETESAEGLSHHSPEAEEGGPAHVPVDPPSPEPPPLPFEVEASLTGQSRLVGYDYRTSIWRITNV